MVIFHSYFKLPEGITFITINFPPNFRLIQLQAVLPRLSELSPRDVTDVVWVTGRGQVAVVSWGGTMNGIVDVCSMVNLDDNPNLTPKKFC
jgi:hypothetical protein